MLLINTFDVEPWWTTVPPCVELADWDSMPDRTQGPLQTYLDICDEAGVKCTFFFIGWYGIKFPQRIREVVERGHEVGCHSLFHEDVANLAYNEFRANTREAKARLEDVAGQSVISYRAPSFSFPVERCAELLGILREEGFLIDSSICTASRIHGGGYRKDDFIRPLNLKDKFGVDIFEIPVNGVPILGGDVQIFGGGYLRIVPPAILNGIAATQDFQVLYLHPHDFDDNLPPLINKGKLFNYRRSVKIGDTVKKVTNLFSLSTVRSCGQIINNEGD